MKRKTEQPEYTARHAAGQPVLTEEQSHTTEFPMVGEQTNAYNEVIPSVEEPPVTKPKAKRRGWFRRRAEARAQAKALLLAEEATDEEDTAPVEEVSDDTREIPSTDGTMERTQVIELAEEGGSHLAEEEPAQMLLEGFGEEESTAEPELGREETLRRIRLEKIQDFEQRREQHERELANAEQAAETDVSGESEQTAAEEETPVAVEEPLQETLETVSLGVLRQQLNTQIHHSNITLMLGVLLEAVLFFIAAFSVASPAIAMNPITYLLLHLVVFGGLLVTNVRALRRGLSVLFKRHRWTTEGVAAWVAILTLVHTALLALNTTGIADGSAPMLTGITGFGLLLLQIANRLELNRRLNDVAIMAAPDTKLVAKHIENDVTAEEIGRPAVALGVPRVAYFRTTEDIEGYTDTEGFDPTSNFLDWYLPVTVALSLLCAFVFLLLNGFTSWIYAVTLLCGMMAVSLPVVLCLSLRATLAVADKHIGEYQTAISDFRAVESFGDIHAVALDAMELFPETSVLLHGIKTFSGTRVDEAILDAASVCIRAGGPLSHVFRRMIVNKVDMLHEVDTLVYEQDMGLSGWISGRRILIGNRRLLDNHGIDIPSRDYEERYAKNGRQLVYLSIAGELSAMFVVSYTADPQVQRVLKSLTERHITLLVRTCDQNISESLLTSVFALDGFYVELLNAPAGRSFETLVAGVSATEPAAIVSADNSLGVMAALAQCRRLRAGRRVFQVLQAMFGIIGMVIMAVVSLFGGAMFQPLYAIGMVAGSAVILSVFSLLFSKK